MEQIIDSEITIKEYSDEYEQKVIEFLINVAVKEFGFKDWEKYFYNKEFLPKNDFDEKFWIAVNNENEVVGTIAVVESQGINTAKITSLYVAKEYRQRKIATKLFNICMDFIKNCDYNIVILHTYKEFSNAIKFYEKIGFKPSKSIKSKDGIWYEKHINGAYKWKDYFSNLRNKYNMRVSKKNPLIINLDGKNTTSNIFYSLIDNSKNGFIDIMEKTVKHFTEEYNCIAIFGTDEVSFIFDNADDMIYKINDDRNFKVDEIISIFSQYFFEYFNTLNTKEKIYWHGEIFSIPKGKIKSYIQYKSGSIFNVFTTYFLKKNQIKDAGHIKMNDKLELCNKMEYWREVEEYAEGIMYYKGDRIDIKEYLNGNIKVIKSENRTENEYVDLTAFNDLF